MSTSDKLLTGIGILLLPLNIALGVAQMLAIFSGVQYWLDWHWFFCSLVSTILVFFLRINLLNCVIGVLGAHYAWHWSWTASIALFFGVFALMIVIALTAGAAEKAFRW
ncbi:hypothetical protein [Pseudomonas capsici]|uniref:hypothetical protein n=1 Tax=Pseudomonas capsici TaxID=2810614 RepID=UPI0021F18B01|nr:hypothetical protein [Pseudomonas capsici]MCV4343286.1 hypothetical protein [Pseudomonas capsici]